MTDNPVERVALLPCPNPWCGDWSVQSVETREGGFFRVGCTCGVAAPACTREDQAIAIWNTRALNTALLNDIAAMMSEFVDNWPQPKKVSTALALIAKTLRAALDPPKHKFWGAGEPDCPREIKAGNGELHTLRCKVCGVDSPRDDFCRVALNNAEEYTSD